MLKKSFFGFSKPCFHYQSPNISNIIKANISNPKNITLYIKEEIPKKSSAIKCGDKVKTGQKIFFKKNTDNYIISSVTGKVQSIQQITYKFGELYTSISINVSKKDEIDNNFQEAYNECTMENMKKFLLNSPGNPPILRFFNKKTTIKKIIVYAGDNDLFSHYNLYTLNQKNNFNYIKQGIKYLKKASKIENISIIIPENTINNYSGDLDAQIKTISYKYPSSQPLMILYNILGKLPLIKNLDSGFNDICLIKLEALSSIGFFFKEKKIPTNKQVIIIDKNKKEYLTTVPIGTHINHILKKLKININNGDKIIIGGPMTGNAAFSVEQPILPDTDIIYIQDNKKIYKYSDYPCINCGECIGICPGKVPINLLVRFLEASKYEEGAELYDLYSCIECGLCAYVCPSKIPILQYIKLAKYELNRVSQTEESYE